MTMWGLFLLNLLPIGILLALSRKNAVPFLTSSLLHPYFFLALILLLYNIDFLVLGAGQSATRLSEMSASIPVRDVWYAFAVFSALQAALVAGILLAGAVHVPNRAVVGGGIRAARVVGAMLVVVSVAVTFGSLALGVSFLSLDVTHQNFYRENQALWLVKSLCNPAMALYVLSSGKWRHSDFLVLAGAVAVATLGGSRSSVLFASAIAGMKFALLGWRIRQSWTLVAIPALGAILLVLRFYLREQWRYGSIVDFVAAQGGVVGTFFSTAEVSMADAFTMAYIYSDDIAVFPFQGFLFAASLLIPRSFWPGKPISPSGSFTDALSPTRWEITRSELTVTGFGDMLLEFGLVGALIACALFAFVWGYLVKKSAKAIHSVYQRFVFVALYWSVYSFVRGDMGNLGGLLWPFVLVYVIWRIAAYFIKDRVVRGSH
ncbi:hypothetical protein AAG565_15445 [Fontimonas sp. SYSU GA230001]|uniref:hypothetical protein n=1 Tax=Fontimonas sp. SYSU GA230001 TaxID=3142450 RepID=UPI0032B36F31